MAEPLHGNIADAEQTILWSSITDAFKNNAFTLGLQIADRNYYRHGTASYVLQVALDESTSFELWGHGSESNEIRSATLFLRDAVTDTETCVYEVTPKTIRRYITQPPQVEPDDIRKLHQQIENADWNLAESQRCAELMIFES